VPVGKGTKGAPAAGKGYGGFSSFGVQSCKLVDATYDGIHQFNSAKSKAEICETISLGMARGCEAFTEYGPSCGNGVVEDGEECECASGTACSFCQGCVLEVGKECTPDAATDPGCCHWGSPDRSARTTAPPPPARFERASAPRSARGTMASLYLDKVRNAAEDAYGQARGMRDETEKKVFEALNNKNWGASSTTPWPRLTTSSSVLFCLHSSII